MTLYHRYGGTVTAITHVGHGTDHNRVGYWFYMGTTEWDDGSKSENHEIAPTSLCSDTTEGHDKIVRLNKQLMDYLRTAGEFHEPKHHRDGRVTHWTPLATAGLRRLDPPAAAVREESAPYCPVPGDSAADLDRIIRDSLPVRELLAEAINQWPEYDTEDEEVDGCDLVTWFGNWRERVKAVLR